MKTTQKEEKQVLRAVFGARICRLKPDPHFRGIFRRGWYICGPLVEYFVVRYDDGSWAAVRFTPDRDGVNRANEQWVNGRFFGRPRGCWQPERCWRHLVK